MPYTDKEIAERKKEEMRRLRKRLRERITHRSIFQLPFLIPNFLSNFLVFIALLFALWGLIVVFDANNYIDATGRGTALVCVGIVFAVLSLTYRK